MAASYKKLFKMLIDREMKSKDLAAKAGVSPATLAKMKKDGATISSDVLVKICTALDCTLDDIVEIIPDLEMGDKNISPKSIITSTPRVVSLFSGAGGLDIGFEQAGFSVAVAVEIDPACCDTLLTNRPNTPVINKNICEVTGDEILEIANLKPLETALVIGGPPCQSFSLAGLRKGLDDERGKLLFEFVRIVREILPVGFVLENVKGLTNWDSGKALDLLIEELTKPIEYNGVVYQYTVAPPQVLDAADYGVPQHRERLILVGNRCNFNFEYPQPVQEKKTVWNAIGSLPTPEQPSETAMCVANSIKGRREKHGY